MGKKRRLDLSKLIPELEFYGTGDEGYELFSSACSFCYQLCGLGYNDRAEIVYGWAKEMADHSKEWYLQEGREDDKFAGCEHEFNRDVVKFCSECGRPGWLRPGLDMEKGRWGY